MEYQRIINLLDNTPYLPTKFRTKKIELKQDKDFFFQMYK